MSFWAFGGLINGIVSSILGLFVYLNNPKNPLNRLWVIFASTVAFWSYSYFLWQISADKSHALFWCRSLMLGAIFIPVTFLHFLLVWLEIYQSKKKLLFVSYCISLIASVLNLTPFFIKEVSAILFFKYWPRAGVVYLPFLIFWAWLVFYCLYIMFQVIDTSSPAKRNQIRYVLFGAIIGFGGGFTNYPLWYGIKILPYGNILVSVCVGLMAYAIIKFRLMDIKVVLTRAGIFAVVYTLVLGLPFIVIKWLKPVLIPLLGENWWIVILVFGMILASAGPFIYLFLQGRAENIILKDQRRYQNTLRQLSATLTLIKDMDRLLKFIVFRVARTVKAEFACIYLASDAKLIQKFPYTMAGFFPEFPSEIPLNSGLISYLKERRKPIFAEELRQAMKKEFNLRNGLIVPSFVRGRLLGFLLLGPKARGIIYTEEDVSVFGILANQLGLAIENSEFIEESQKTQAQLFAAEQMASLGTMAGGMTHQINNRFHAIILASGDLIDTLKFFELEQASKDKIKGLFEEMKHNLERVNENAKHGGKIVNDFLNFSQPERLQREAKEFDLKEPLERAIEMVRIKTAFPEDLIEKQISDNLPKIQGNFVLIQDAYFNLIDNAIDALARKEEAIKNKKIFGAEGGYKGKILIRMHKTEDKIITQIQDNGIGMDEETQKKIFVPFFTTKATAFKGTGLGLYVIQRIIYAHQGEIKVSSSYGQGTNFNITLPIRQMEIENNG